MLKLFRKYIKLIIWLIVISFVAWGAGTLSVSQNQTTSYAGAVGGEKILNKYFLMTLRFYELLTRNRELTLDIGELRGLVWQTLVLHREAKRQNLSVTDDEVRAEIERIFSLNGTFNQHLYDTWMKTNFQSKPREFEEALRKHLASQKLRNQYLEGVPDEARNEVWFKKIAELINNAHVEDYSTAPADTQSS